MPKVIKEREGVNLFRPASRRQDPPSKVRPNKKDKYRESRRKEPGDRTFVEWNALSW